MSENISFEKKVLSEEDPSVAAANEQVTLMLKREIIKNTVTFSENMLKYIDGLITKGDDSYRIVEQIRHLLEGFVKTFPEKYEEETKNLNKSVASNLARIREQTK